MLKEACPGLQITIRPFEGTDPHDVRALAEELASLGVRATLNQEVRLPAAAYDVKRRQYRGDIILEATRLAPDERVLGVTNRDLYVGRLNFVFGLAEPSGRVAVISLCRLRAGAGEATFRARLVKEAVHEVGHTLGLPHCSDVSCVMAFSNSLADTDRKGKWFCRQCEQAVLVRSKA